jgi:SAM-dependent methyltransferase
MTLVGGVRGGSDVGQNRAAIAPSHSGLTIRFARIGVAAMSTTSRHDAWQAGSSYDQYMGRWSRKVAPRFLDWLGVPNGRDWLEIGCGTGALSAAILAQAAPASLVSVDPSADFLAQARTNVADPRVTFQIGDAQALPMEDASRDVAVSALVLNFVPDKAKAFAEMQRVTRPGGTIAFYVWDYAGGGLAFLREFWNAAVALDPAAADLTEDKRFPDCTRDGIADLARSGGLKSVEVEAIDVPTVFADFNDYWRPFTLGAGPAPGYCSTLAPAALQRLKERLDASLPRQADGAIHLQARAWAARASVR